MLLYNSGNSGGARPKAIFSDKEGHWLVKFRHTYDPMDMGLSEFRYNELARAAGITVPDFKMVADKYFASKRFDISETGERIHVATSGALLSVSLSQPILDYTNLLALTAYLTHDLKQVEEMFRRMIFNYLSGNKDDHCKNFSFLVRKDSLGKWKWQLAPAYDLTLCAEGYNGEHATSVNGSGRPSMADFIYVGRKFRLSEIKCSEIIKEVSDACRDILRYDLK